MFKVLILCLRCIESIQFGDGKVSSDLAIYVLCWNLC